MVRVEIEQELYFVTRAFVYKNNIFMKENLISG